MRRQLIKKIIKIVEMSDECFNHDIRIDNLRFCIKQNSTHKYYNMIVHYKKFYRIKTFYWPNNKVYSVFNDIVKDMKYSDRVEFCRQLDKILILMLIGTL